MSTELAVRPGYVTFNAKQSPEAEKQLLAVLTRNDKKTDTIPITKLRDAVLNTEGLIQNRYQMTTVALSQLCSLLAPGFSQTVYSLSGLRMCSEDAKDERCDNAMAIKLFNELVTFRFSRVSGFQLVVDRNTNKVEGLIGRKYNYFSNLETYQRVKSFVSKHKTAPAGFTEGILYGRRMVLRFCSLKPIFEITERRRTGEPFFGGYQFENTEVGNCALRGSTVLIRQWCDNKAVAPFLDRNRVRHVRGPAFERRVEEMLDRLDLRTGEATRFRERVLALMDTNLDLGKEKDKHNERFGSIFEKLVKRRISKGLANRVLKRMLVAGSYRADAFKPDDDPMELYAKRTAYDLFNALTAEAKSEALDERIEAEQLAYALLMGRFQL